MPRSTDERDIHLNNNAPPNGGQVLSSMNPHTAQVVGVGFPNAAPGIYDYEIPERFRGRLAEGTPVLVDLRGRSLWGVAVVLRDHSRHGPLKEVKEVRSGGWEEGRRSLVGLYEWIASYYQCELGKVFRPFVRKGIVEVGPKKVRAYRTTGKEDETGELTPAQNRALHDIAGAGVEPPTTRGLRESLGVSSHMLDTLCRKKYLEKRWETVSRRSEELSMSADRRDLTLSPRQKEVVETVAAHMGRPSSPFLLHGVTGSGKTFVYAELARRALEAGKGAIILVPEISLTPQTIQRFRSVVGDVVAVMHSRMSEGRRRDSLEEVVSGARRLVVGARSAILAPMSNVGLIVVDEEHDGSYKQGEMDPRYHARDVAVMRGRRQGAVVVLGSATPSMESYYNALGGKYRLLTLDRRYGPATLPRVTLVDMTEERRLRNWSILSGLLRERIETALHNGRQIILLLNRRGFSVALICKECGHTYECPHCSVKLKYHRTGHCVRCHQCGFEQPAPTLCRQCGGDHLTYRGTAIQKAEDALHEEFPGARILRMDQDSTRRRGAHVALFEKFARKEADILLGTQMVAKGLDFPGVALVGVLQADIGLHIPEFRASERTFHLLAQVAGRAGREDDQGEVVIQTYFPKDTAMVCAAEHDFERFYSEELHARKTLGYPPFGRMIRVVVSGPDEEAVKRTIGRLARTGVGRSSEVTLLGPSPAVLSRIGDAFRYAFVVKSKRPTVLQRSALKIRSAAGRLPGGMKLIVDVDPVGML